MEHKNIYDAKQLHQLMKLAARSTDKNLILNYADIGSEQTILKYSNYSDQSLLQRFLRFWMEQFSRNHIVSSTNQDSITIHAPYQHIRHVIEAVKKESERTIKKECEAVEQLNKKLNTITPTTKQQQVDNDAKLSELLQWKELHCDEKRETFLTEQESKQLKTDLEQQYNKFKP